MRNETYPVRHGTYLVGLTIASRAIVLVISGLILAGCEGSRPKAPDASMYPERKPIVVPRNLDEIALPKDYTNARALKSKSRRTDNLTDAPCDNRIQGAPNP